MKRTARALAIALAMGGTASAIAQLRIVDPKSGLQLGSFAGDATLRDDRAANRGYLVQFAAKDRHLEIRLPANTSFAGRTHLDLRLVNRSVNPAELEIDLASGPNDWLSSRLVLGANEAVEVSVPLRLASDYGLRLFPAIADAGRHQTASQGTFTPTSVQTVFLWNKGATAAGVQLERVEAATHSVPLTNIVDQFGQQRGPRWVGKVLSVGELPRHRLLDPTTEAYPYPADPYGGVLGGQNYGPDTKFRLRKDHGRWFFLTPAGNRFFSLGVNEVGTQAWTPVTGRAALFTNIGSLQSQFPNHFSVFEGRTGYTPYSINLQRKYGANWRALAETAFTRRLKTWGLNTLGVGSWASMIAAKKVPSAFGGAIVGAHRFFPTYDGRFMHDPWDPLFVTDVRRTIGERLATTGGNHEASVGIFLDNELPWGDRFRTETRYRHGLAYGALQAQNGQAIHETLIDGLVAKYGTIQNLNAAWGTSFGAWDSLDTGAVVLPVTPTPGIAEDFAAFARTYATRYFSVVRDELRARGYQGPYLGCRFEPGVPPEVLEVARQYCDVLSFNVYHARPSEAIPYARTIDHPILISEFAFGANDLGRVGVPYYPTLTDRSRLEALARFTEDVKTFPNLVGAHWYRWEDLPVTGKVDFDNAALGLNSITDLPYKPLTDRFRQTSQTLATLLRNLG